MATMKQAVGFLLATGAAIAVYKLSQMTKEERNEWLGKIKDETLNFLEKADVSMNKVNHYLSQVKEKNPDQWVDKIMVVKNMVSDFYQSAKGSKPAEHAQPATAETQVS